MTEQRKMNERLQFSWGHIFAFIALIVVSYISFVGYTYLTNGNFPYALVAMAFTDVVYLVVFIGAQQLKASGTKMRRKIIWERIFIFGSPLIFIVGMIPMSHFWTVRSQNDEIVASFTNSINDAKLIFADYEDYANKRISDYSNLLNQIISNKHGDLVTYQKAGFGNQNAEIQKENMVETLQLQLLSQNYDSLKNGAIKWIDDASRGASTWNVFLIGNTREIKDAVRSWENQLKSFSAKELSNESLRFEVPKFSSTRAQAAIAGIDELTSSFTNKKSPNFAAVIFGIIMYLMLLFPYILQNRHTKSVYRLFGSVQTSYNENNRLRKEKRERRKKETDSENSENLASTNSLNDDSNELNLEEDNNYPSF